MADPIYIGYIGDDVNADWIKKVGGGKPARDDERAGLIAALENTREGTPEHELYKAQLAALDGVKDFTGLIDEMTRDGSEV